MKAVHPDPGTVSGYRLRVTLAAPSADEPPRWRERSEVLAQWLLHEWHRAQRQGALSDARDKNVVGRVRGGDSPSLN